MSTSNQMKVKRIVRILQTAVVLVCALVVFGNGCAEGGFYPAGDTMDQSSQLAGSCKDPNEIDVIPGAKTASVVGSTQIVHHLASCTGLEVISELTEKVYTDKVGSVSTYGAVNTLTPPMMMAVHSIAGEVCNDVIDQEIERGTRIFSGWDLAASSLPSDSQLASAAQNMALSCWQDYDLTSDERNIILGAVVDSVGANEANASRKAAVIICTSMLSSLNALLN